MPDRAENNAPRPAMITPISCISISLPENSSWSSHIPRWSPRRSPSTTITHILHALTPTDRRPCSAAILASCVNWLIAVWILKIFPRKRVSIISEVLNVEFIHRHQFFAFNPPAWRLLVLVPPFFFHRPRSVC